MKNITNTQDILDSRDILDRIEELEGEATITGEETDELKTLKILAREGEQCAQDWRYGATLVRESWFREYAQELAEDCGLVDANASWPSRCIDWDQAANELRMDYTPLDFGGVTYWAR